MFNKNMAMLTAIKPNYRKSLNIGFYAKTITVKPNFSVKHPVFPQSLQYGSFFTLKEINKKIKQKVISTLIKRFVEVPPLRTENFFIHDFDYKFYKKDDILNTFLTANGDIDLYCRKMKENYKDLRYSQLTAIRDLFYELEKNELFYNKSAIYLRVSAFIMLLTEENIDQAKAKDIDITDPRIIEAIRFVGSNLTEELIEEKRNAPDVREAIKKFENMSIKEYLEKIGYKGTLFLTNGEDTLEIYDYSKNTLEIYDYIKPNDDNTPKPK